MHPGKYGHRRNWEMNIPAITTEDCAFIYDSLSSHDKEKLSNSTIMITGFAGSLGYTLLHFFKLYKEELQIKKVYGIDSFIFGKPTWLERISEDNLFDLRQLDIVSCELEFAQDVDLIFHMASLASPVFYRKHPIETLDADVIGLRRLLDYYKTKDIKGFLFYSSSEIYGDPHPEQIPTSEDYWGNVNTVGPRACYDESKRFGETLCYNFAREYGIPVTVVRPFNNYGPGMRINDQRVVADFAGAVLKGEDLVIYSDGTPTRTFDYIADATIGYLKSAIYGKFEVFNIGSDSPELSVMELAELYKKIGEQHFGFEKSIIFKQHKDKEYMTDNPNRRCPNISKAKSLLGYNPQIHVDAGIKRYLDYLHTNVRSEYEWGIK